jgi:hypothetical protein
MVQVLANVSFRLLKYMFDFRFIRYKSNTSPLFIGFVIHLYCKRYEEDKRKGA